jgi:Ecdysteroid kinase-like family
VLLDDITPVWLTDVLGSCGAATGEVTAIDVVPISVGYGLVAAVARLRPTWSGGSGPATVIAKYPSPAESSRAIAAALGMYRKEVGFYQQLAEGAALPHAQCFYAHHDAESDDFILLLGDLAGDRPVDQMDGASPREIQLAVDHLADFHAGYWQAAELGASSWLTHLADPPFPQTLAFAVEQAWPSVRDRFASLISPEIDELGTRFAELVPRLAAHLSREPCTLSHGDYRLDNMFFYEAGGMAVCDWQLVDRSRGARDLAYFLTQSVAPELRTEVERAMVARYVERLASHGVLDYPVDTAWHDYRVAALFGFVYPVVAGGGIDHVDDRSRAICETALERSITAIVQLQCEDLVLD